MSHEKHNDVTKVINIGNLSYIIELIQLKLGKSGVEKFLKMCFGLFLYIQTLRFCSAVVHSLLIQQMECNDPKVAEFNFRGVGVWFDKKAFALVTVLKYGNPPSYDETSRLTDWLWTKYFGPNNELQLREFIEKYECHLFDQSEVDDNIKVAMFFLLEYVFLSDDKKKPINNTNFKII